MLMIRFVRWILPTGLMALATGVVFAQAYPVKPIHIITSPAGGGGDFASRLIAAEITGALGQPLVVENRPTNLAGDIALKAAPDGYTLLIAGGAFVVGPIVTKVSYDTERDFLPISMVSKVPGVLVVHPSVPVKSVKELIALAKARPGDLNFASGAFGGGNHRASALFASMAGIKIVLVPYVGSARTMPDLLSGAVHLTFETGALVMPYVKLGKLRALAVTTAQPSALFPGLPTIAATLPGYESVSLTAVWAPAKTPAAIITRLSQEIVRALNRAEVKEKFLTSGVEPGSSSPEELAAIVKAELALYGKLAKEAGIKVE